MPNLLRWQPCVTAAPVRRLAVQLLALLLAHAGVLPASASAPVEANTPANEIQSQASFQRHYKATVYVTLLSIPIFSRSGVGFGFAGADEHNRGAQQSLSLRFLSGSTPERAHGLNRFGFIQENVEQKNRKMVAADYFGLMTASAEESFNDAKAALNATNGPQVPFVAARAAIDQQKTIYSVRHMFLPSSYRGSNAEQLLEQVQAEFAAPPVGQAAGPAEKTETLEGAATGTFLSSLRQAILSADGTYENRIVFNGKTFQFHASKRPD